MHTYIKNIKEREVDFYHSLNLSKNNLKNIFTGLPKRAMNLKKPKEKLVIVGDLISGNIIMTEKDYLEHYDTNHFKIKFNGQKSKGKLLDLKVKL